MSARSFFDTQVLTCADDRAAAAKQKVAIELVAKHCRAGTGVLSLQVLQEYFVTAIKKLHIDPGVAAVKSNCLPNST